VAPKPPPVPVVQGTAATGLNAPWGIAFLPHGEALVAERDQGRILRISPTGQKHVVGQVPGVVAEGEGGLLGIALSPSFSRDRLLFAYVTAAKDNRILRMRYGPKDRLSQPTVVFSGIPKAYNHNGGRILFGPDRMLYVGTGDAAVRARAQDRRSLGGKILRMTPAGRPAPGNPFKGSVVWTYGHRNVQGLTFDSHHRLWASELGQDTYDELNLVHKGRNYGWPIVEGRGGDSRFVDPVLVWRPADASPSGLAYSSGTLWMAALRGERLWRIPLNGANVGKPTFFYRQTYGRLRTVVPAPKGGIWVTTSNTDGVGRKRSGDDRILRVALRQP
jgi:aldose sugar dehydrogenase